jgi:hypothetical protein
LRHFSIVAVFGLALLAGGTVILPGTPGVVAAGQSGTMYAPIPYRPRDFAFIHARGLFHLFYIRHSYYVAHDDSTEIDFGHAVSQDLTNWTQRDPILHVRPGSWDDLHVWAPSIIQRDGTYYLYYAGVTRVPYAYSLYQRIGVATSEDLETWTRCDAPVYGGNQAPWVFADSSRYEGCQFRDPHVIEDPTGSDAWLMYYSATPQEAANQLIVGIARNGTGLTAWEDLKPLWNTDAAHFQGFTESPCMFPHGGRWYLFFSTNSGHPIRFQHAASPTADSTGWVGTYRLSDNAPDTDAWFAPEYLKVGSHEYFAAANSSDNSIEIREMSWTGVASFTLATPSVTAVPGGAETEPPAPGITPLANGQGGVTLRFQVDLPHAMEAEVSIHDISGRKVGSLHQGRLPGGATTLAWDRKDEAGRDVGAGIYFVRLTTVRGSRSAKTAVLR